MNRKFRLYGSLASLFCKRGQELLAFGYLLHNFNLNCFCLEMPGKYPKTKFN